MANFEVFTRKSSPVKKDPVATIQRKGIFSLNAAAFEALGSPVAVELLYDPGQRVIGLRPADESLPHAYTVRSVGSGSSRLIAGTAFTNHHNINTEVARRYWVVIENGILIIDLKKEGIEVTGPRLKAHPDSE